LRGEADMDRQAKPAGLVENDPQRTYRADISDGWALLEGEDTLPIILHIDDGPFILGSGIQGFVEATE
jgi:hypothetical protein